MNPSNIEPWTTPPETKMELDWASLLTVDLSRYDLPGGKQSLAEEMKEAVRTCGFWTVINSAIPQDLVDRQFAIANAFFNLPIEEKRQVVVDYAGGGSHFGYREPVQMHLNDGVKEVRQNLEILNVPKISPPGAVRETTEPLHDYIAQFRDEIAAFQRLCYEKVIRRFLVLFSIMLELPEDYFIDRHRFSSPSEDHIRMLKYHPRPEEVDNQVKHTWLAGHTDFGSLTLLFSQPIAALQILTPTNEWKWVKPVKGGIICNAADVLSFLTKGYIKSCVHRVIRPPADQVQHNRIGVIYFLRPGNHVPMIPAPSPVLLREGLISEDNFKGERSDEAVTGYEYVRARVAHVNTQKTWRVDGEKAMNLFQVKNLSVQDYYV
ncbi:flavonol synthase [Moniliophthora roreri MCA 2997]|uniref:Flavonol synthase n=1 Tax=Moniliophthora roreri (strain MCA 2997) TaxID=1381753 RepID=V2XVZ0_MONRO|nr:flavonol synthase [Moniliophthora roreri MCA 2997]